MKKFIAVVLSITMLLPFAVLPGFAEAPQQSPVRVEDGAELDSVFAEGENSLILFVTGIGQSFSYLFDESYTAPGAFESGTLQDFENYAPLIAQGKFSGRWNLFNNDFSAALKDKETLKSIGSVVMNLLFSMFTRKNTVKDEDVYTIIEKLFSYNIVDENGKCDSRVVTPRYICPLSEYPGVYNENGEFVSEAKDRFYGSVPCAEIARKTLGANYEDYLYCYNYCAFSYTSDNVEGLHEYIETVLADNKVGAKDVVLVPMSMGASVVSAYLDKYPAAADNHVRRVVSIVGCWNGSDVVTDLILNEYADNSAQLFYNGIIAEMVGEPWGYLVNFVLRFFPKAALRDFIDQALSAFVDTLFLSAPSLVALVPSYDYEQIRDYIDSDAVRSETDAYYRAQSTLKSRLEALNEQGISVSFIAGYGLPYGAVTSDYTAFGFMNSAESTNSDEIINISSTVPGTSYTAYNESFKDTAGRRLSPDGSLDISTAYYPDSSWFFKGQKHELEYNNTAISLAIELALGNIKTVADCDNAAEDGYYYPQFNGARNLKSLKRGYIPDMERFCKENNYTLNSEQQALYNRVLAMTNSTVNDFEADNALIESFYNMLVEMGVYQPAAEPSRFESFVNSTLKKGNDFTYRLFGAKGFLDIGGSAGR